MDDFTEQKFIEFIGTDFDYLIICKNNANSFSSWNTIPNRQPSYWDTIDEAIKWHLENDWDIVEIYDLYAEFSKAMIRRVSKTSDPNNVAQVNDLHQSFSNKDI